MLSLYYKVFLITLPFLTPLSALPLKLLFPQPRSVSMSYVFLALEVFLYSLITILIFNYLHDYLFYSVNPKRLQALYPIRY